MEMCRRQWCVGVCVCVFTYILIGLIQVCLEPYLDIEIRITTIFLLSCTYSYSYNHGLTQTIRITVNEGQHCSSGSSWGGFCPTRHSFQHIDLVTLLPGNSIQGHIVQAAALFYKSANTTSAWLNRCDKQTVWTISTDPSTVLVHGLDLINGTQPVHRKQWRPALPGFKHSHWLLCVQTNTPRAWIVTMLVDQVLSSNEAGRKIPEPHHQIPFVWHFCGHHIFLPELQRHAELSGLHKDKEYRIHSTLKIIIATMFCIWLDICEFA